MRSARVALTTLRRLDKVAALVDEQGALRQPVLLVPPILPIDEWERIALPMQVSLMEACQRDAGLQVVPLPDQPDPHDLREGIDFHRPDPNRRQENEEP